MHYTSVGMRSCFGNRESRSIVRGARVAGSACSASCAYVCTRTHTGEVFSRYVPNIARAFPMESFPVSSLRAVRSMLHVSRSCTVAVVLTGAAVVALVAGTVAEAVVAAAVVAATVAGTYQ